jgi:hypothetical protein
MILNIKMQTIKKYEDKTIEKFFADFISCVD